MKNLIKKTKRAFTLIELIVVTALIIILASATTTGLVAYLDRSQSAADAAGAHQHKYRTANTLVDMMLGYGVSSYGPPTEELPPTPDPDLPDGGGSEEPEETEEPEEEEPIVFPDALAGSSTMIGAPAAGAPANATYTAAVSLPTDSRNQTREVILYIPDGAIPMEWYNCTLVSYEGNYVTVHVDRRQTDFGLYLEYDGLPINYNTVVLSMRRI